MPSKNTNRWNDYQKTADKAVSEVEESTSVAMTPIPKQEEKIHNTGTKRKPYGSSNRTPLNGCSSEDSDKIRELVSLRFMGFTIKEACENVGLPVGSAGGYMARHRDAFDLAEHELMETCLRSYQSNLWMMRTALSEIGPRAVRTLATIMDDKKVAPGTRLKAATTVLKLVDVDHSATGGANEGLAKEFVGFLKEARREIQASTIMDVEEAEVIEDGMCGN